MFCVKRDITQSHETGSGIQTEPVFYHMKIIFDYNRTLFNPDTGALYEGVVELLQYCSTAHELFLVSKEEPMRMDQFKKIGIEPYFQKCFFVTQKTDALFQDIGKEATRCIVVGDRISGEIAIGNRLGFVTVRLKQGKFSTEYPATAEEEPTEELTDIRDFKKVLERYAE
jgi:FMN phosphatase YigB (HAD superfamily)